MDKSELESLRIAPNIRSDGTLELTLRCLVQFCRAVYRELTSYSGLPWKQRLKAWRYGFSSISWILYELDRNEPDMFVPDLYAALRACRINGFFNPIVGDKLVLSRILESHGLPHPAVISTIVKGRLHAENAPFDPDLAGALQRTLERFPHQVFRPTWSGAGEGVFFLEHLDNALHLNGVRVVPEKVCGLISSLDRYVATEFIEQASYARAVYPDSPNTLRLLTLWDLDSHEPFVAAASHRFGSARSAPVDNWHRGRGGLSAAIDLETSTLGKACTLSGDGRLLWTSTHPETEQPIEDVAVPGLSTCVEGVLDAAAKLPFCPCIGWDVILTDQGFRIIEANPLPGLYVWQVHSPLLTDPRTRKFFRTWRLVRD